MRLLLLFSCALLILAAYAMIEIPLMRHKSPRQLMIEAGVSKEQFNMLSGHGKPKLKSRTNDTIALYKFLDGEYYGIMQIGHPGQKFKFLIDTSWIDSWVFSKYCPLFYPACVTHNKYDALASSTYLPNGTEYKVDMGNSTIEGILSTDNVNVGHLIVEKFTFAEITKAPLSLLFGYADGIMGFALKDPKRMTPIFYELYKQNLVSKPIFSFYINRDETTKHAGSVFLGGYEKRHFNESSLFYLPLININTLFWQVKMERIELKDNQQSNIFCKNGCVAQIETGSRVTEGPYEDITLLNRLLGAVLDDTYNRYVIDCDLIPKLPSLYFTLGTKTFKLHGKELVQKIHPEVGHDICLSIFVPNSSSPQNSTAWSIGSSFLQRIYVICDVEKKRVGFADTV